MSVLGKANLEEGGGEEEGVRADDVTYINFLLGVSALGKAHLEGEGRWGGRGRANEVTYISSWCLPWGRCTFGGVVALGWLWVTAFC